MKEEKIDFYEDRGGFRGKKRLLNENVIKKFELIETFNLIFVCLKEFQTASKKVFSNGFDYGKTNFLVHRIGEKKIVVKPREASTPVQINKPFQNFNNKRENNNNGNRYKRQPYNSNNNNRNRNANVAINTNNNARFNQKPMPQAAPNRINQNMDLNNNIVQKPTSSNQANAKIENISPIVDLNNNHQGTNIVVTQEFLVDFAQNFAQEFSQRFFSHFSTEINNLNSILFAQMQQNANFFHTN